MTIARRESTAIYYKVDKEGKRLNSVSRHDPDNEEEHIRTGEYAAASIEPEDSQYEIVGSQSVSPLGELPLRVRRPGRGADDPPPHITHGLVRAAPEYHCVSFS